MSINIVPTKINGYHIPTNYIEIDQQTRYHVESTTIHGLTKRYLMVNNQENDSDCSWYKTNAGPGDCRTREFSSDDQFVLRQCLEELVNKKDKIVILEIGVNRLSTNKQGQTSTDILLTKRKNDVYVGIDLDDKSYLDSKDDNIYTIKSNSGNTNYVCQLLKKLNVDTIDLFMIDGYHSLNTVYLDWKYTELLSDDGIVVMHDTNGHPGPYFLLKSIDTNMYDVYKYYTDIVDWGISVAKKKSKPTLVDYFSYRGNINGINTKYENSPIYCLQTIKNGYRVIMDIWLVENRIMSGTYNPLYVVDINFIKRNDVICLINNDNNLINIMEKEQLKYIVKDKLNDNKYSIVFLPENNDNITDIMLKNSKGICSNFIAKYKQRLNAKERIAMIISGRIKCYGNNLKKQIDKFYIDNPDIYIDIFASINNDMDEYHKQFYEDMFPTRYIVEKFICDEKYTSWNNVRNEYKNNRPGLRNYISHAFNNKKAFDALKNFSAKNGITYDKCILFRSDIMNESLPSILFNKFPDKNTIYYPSHHVYLPEWINMEVIISDYDTMGLHCSLYDFIDDYTFKENVILHPETQITFLHKKNGTILNTFEYVYELDPNRQS